MNESLFVPVPPIWTGPVPGPLVSQVTVSTASPLVAAVAARRGQPNGPTTDPEVEELIYDTLELLPGAGDVEVRCEAGRVTLSGSVSHKRLKRDIGEIAWSIPSLVDVMNTVTLTSRRRTRGFAREGESAVPAAGRKQA